MMAFTREECTLMMLYSPGNRSGLMEALTAMKAQLGADEGELLALTESVLAKLSRMDDGAFDRLELYPAF